LIEKVVKDGPNVDPKVKDPANWPAELLAELGNDDEPCSIRWRSQE
jgi:hypothetical protein